MKDVIDGFFQLSCLSSKCISTQLSHFIFFFAKLLKNQRTSFSRGFGGISIQSEKSNNCLVCLLSTKLSQVFCFSGAWKCEGLVLCLVGSPSSLLITLQSFNPSSQVKVAQDFACRNAIHLWLPYCCSSSNVTPHNLRYILLIFLLMPDWCLEYIKS